MENDIINYSNQNNNLFSSNPKNIEFLYDIIEDSYSDHTLDNTFCTFKSINNILYLIYSNEKISIISYDLINNKKINELIKAHENYITNFRYFLDKINKRDLILSISADDNNIKVWNVLNFDCLLNMKEINKKGCLYSACFLNFNDQIYIITSNSTFKAEPIKVFDLEGNKTKIIKNNKESVYFLDVYYHYELPKIYILIGGQGYVISYDFIKDEFYHIYRDNNNECHDSIIIFDKNEIIKLIESSKDGIIRIYDFNSTDLLKKIRVSNLYLVSICIWKDNYLFVGCGDKNIKLVEISEGKITKKLNGHSNSVTTIKKIFHPKYGECLISQGYENNQIKLWAINIISF